MLVIEWHYVATEWHYVLIEWHYVLIEWHSITYQIKKEFIISLFEFIFI
ncbi:MAG: hypothetical protein LKE30_04345 [Bacteroidales bacterium]|nr:hypothetical protein [Bacteroidales bacterium]